MAWDISSEQRKYAKMITKESLEYGVILGVGQSIGIGRFSFCFVGSYCFVMHYIHRQAISFKSDATLFSNRKQKQSQSVLALVLCPFWCLKTFSLINNFPETLQ